MLHNPAYAGVYVFGRRPVKSALIEGEIRKVRIRIDDPSEWPVRIDGAHPAYISWERYMSNQEKLRENRSRAGGVAQGAPREGPSLLAGLVLCGRCGRRMSPRYESRARAHSRWCYICWGESSKGEGICWSVAGPPIDRAVEQLFLETMVPGELELGLAVEREVESQAEALDRSWRTRIEQVRYEARLAERRYKVVDPDNRVVARTLECEWEQRLEEMQKVEKQYEEARQKSHVELSARDRERIRTLARDLPAVWRSSTTQAADRKAMLRLVIEAIAVYPIEVPVRSTRIRVQWKSGVVSELETARPGPGEYMKNAADVLERIRELAGAGRRDDEISRQLNTESLKTGAGLSWSEDRVRSARTRAGIERVAPDRPRMPPLPHRDSHGRYSVPGAAARFGVHRNAVYGWIKSGLVSASRGDFGTHRDVYWLDIDEATEALLVARGHGAKKEKMA